MTMLHLRSLFAVFTLAGAAVLMGTNVRAQDDTPDPTPPAVADAQPVPDTPKTFSPYRRVPSNFGKVGLSNQQREDIYVIRGRYQSEIAELKARIEALSRDEMTECESVLTEAQHKLLVQLRAASRPALLGSSSGSGSGN